jgi:zinc protease
VKRLVAALGALALASCVDNLPAPSSAAPPSAPPPPMADDMANAALMAGAVFVPALRYGDPSGLPAPTADPSFRVSSPAIGGTAMPQPASLQAFTLENGLHVVLVERHGFPMVAARLVIDTSWAMADDVGGRNAMLLGGTYLSPFEHVRQTSAGCGVDGCYVASRGLAGQLPEVLGRIENLVTRASGDPGVYAQRFATYVRLSERAERPIQRNMNALMFGRSHRYGESLAGPVPTLDALKQMRDRSFVPSASTLVVVGDATLDAVRAALGETLAPWAPGKGPRPTPPKPPPPPEGPHIVVYRNGSIGQVWGSVAARGPLPGDGDLPACLVLAQLLGGVTDSALFHGERAELAAAYTVGARVDLYKDASVIALIASFDRDSPIAGMRKMLDAIALARDREPSADDLERAKAGLIAQARHTGIVDEWMASTLGNAALLGSDPTAIPDRAVRIAAVSAADVRAVARRYLAPEALRAVLDGKVELTTGAQSLGLGEPIFTDIHGRPQPPASPVAAGKTPGG